jgi:hypothetical protein
MERSEVKDLGRDLEQSLLRGPDPSPSLRMTDYWHQWASDAMNGTRDFSVTPALQRRNILLF